MASVIIPAHNEEAVIGRTLESLLESVGEQPIEVIVVCNGCTDATAERARVYAPRVTVVETTTASKRHALNLGDAEATSFPRIYLDADIEVSKTFAGDMVQALTTDAVRAAWPSVHFNLDDCSFPVRAFYQVWTALPYNKPGRIGVGAYGLSQAARERFAEFPDVISDDGYVRGLYDDGERVLVDSCQTTVQAPLTLESLVKIRTRSRLGVYELRTKDPQTLRGHRARTTMVDLVPILLRPSILCRLPIYLYVNVVTRIRARNQMRSQSGYEWERDDSTRATEDRQPTLESESVPTT